MSRLRKSVAIALHLAKTSIVTQMQYRADFIIQMCMAIFWVFWNVAPLVVIFRLRPEIAGFDLEQAMLVMSAFLILKSMLDGLIQPNMIAVVEHIRTGTLDFILLKPTDSQLLVSTARVAPAKLVDFAVGVGIAVWSISRQDPAPGIDRLALGALLLFAGAASLYSLWLLVICTAFWFVRIDNLSYLFGALFDAARWPITIFRGWVRFVLTFILPIAVMTSFPALALLGRLPPEGAFLALGLSLAFLMISRRVWLWALQHYASASS
jgi:ABC-2 type transport system permease protein